MASPTSNPFYVVIQTLQSGNILLENFIRRALLEPGIADIFDSSLSETTQFFYGVLDGASGESIS
jgi:hypothetical protein